MLKRCNKYLRILRKGVLFISFLVLMVGYCGQIAKADGSNTPDSVIYVNDPNVAVFVEDVNGSTNKKILTYDTGTFLLRFSNSRYSSLKAYEKKEWMEYSLNYIRNSSIGESNKIKVYNFIADQDSAVSGVVRQLSNNISADFLSGWTFIRPFTGSVNFFLGVFVWLVLIFFSLRVVVDLMFMAEIPLFDWIVLKAQKKPWVISNTAWNVHKQLPDESTSVRMMSYTKKSVASMFVIGFMLMYLITGRIFELVLIIVEMFSGAF